MLPTGERGTILAITGDRLTIDMNPEDVCEECGLTLICRPGSNGEQLLEIVSAGSFQVGQSVKLVEGIDLELKLALTQYGIPLFFFLVGIFSVYPIPQSILPSELLGFMGGLAGLVGSFWVSRAVMGRIARNSSARAIQVEVIPNI
jgi:positive regulator of sigma E activity